jgi:ABC-type Fe3+ transport system permease subunit
MYVTLLLLLLLLCCVAAGVFESWLHPSRYRTQLCKDQEKCDRCAPQQVCLAAALPALAVFCVCMLLAGRLTGARPSFLCLDCSITACIGYVSWFVKFGKRAAALCCR